MWTVVSWVRRLATVQTCPAPPRPAPLRPAAVRLTVSSRPWCVRVLCSTDGFLDMLCMNKDLRDKIASVHWSAARTAVPLINRSSTALQPVIVFCVFACLCFACLCLQRIIRNSRPRCPGRQYGWFHPGEIDLRATRPVPPAPHRRLAMHCPAPPRPWGVRVLDSTDSANGLTGCASAETSRKGCLRQFCRK